MQTQVLDLQSQKHILTSFLVYHQFWTHVFNKKSHFGVTIDSGNLIVTRNRPRSPNSLPQAQELTTTNAKSTTNAFPIIEDVIPIKNSTRQHLQEITRDLIQTYDYVGHLYDEAIKTKLSYRDVIGSCTNFLKNPSPEGLVVSSVGILGLTSVAASVVATHVIEAVFIEQKSAFDKIVKSAGFDLPKKLVETTIALLQDSFDFEKVLSANTSEQLAINIIEVILFASQLSKMFGVSGFIDDIIVLTEKDNFSLDLLREIIIRKKEDFFEKIGDQITQTSTSTIEQFSIETIKNFSSNSYENIRTAVNIMTHIDSTENLKNRVIDTVKYLGTSIIGNIPKVEEIPDIKSCGLFSSIFTSCQQEQIEEIPLWARRILLANHINKSHTATAVYNNARYRVNKIKIPYFFKKLTGCVTAFVYKIGPEAVKPIETAEVGMGEIADVFEVGLTLTTIWLIIGVILCIIMFGYIWWKSSKTIKHAESTNVQIAEAERVIELQFGNFFRV